MLTDILGDAAKPPLSRLRELVHAFVRSECEEAAVRGALNDTARFIATRPRRRRHTPLARACFKRFMEEALPAASASKRALAGYLITTTMSAVGKECSELPRTDVGIQAYADGPPTCSAPISAPTKRLEEGPAKNSGTATPIFHKRKSGRDAPRADVVPLVNSGRRLCIARSRREPGLTELGNPDAIEFGAVFDGFLAARHRF